MKATKAYVVPSADLTVTGESMDIELVQLGDFVKVTNGTQVPIDGVVAVGSGLCNESMLTGEDKPVSKGIGSKVFGGSMLTVGSLIIKVEKLGENATIN